jgi:hypothetical protein
VIGDLRGLIVFFLQKFLTISLYQRRNTMKKALLSFLVAGLLCTAPMSPAFAGVEPSPFFPDIGLIQQRLILIGQSYTLSDTTRDSLAALDLRLNTQLNDWVTPELATSGGDVIGRICSFLSNSQSGATEDYAIQLIASMDRISRILFDPQPEPPGVVTQGFTVLDRISWVLFDPQPEPPGLSPELQAQSISVMYQVSGVMERTTIAGLQEGTIPGLNALEQLSGHLVDAVIRAKPDKAAAQVNAMSNIAAQYAGY